MIKKSCAFTGHRPSAFAFGYHEDDPRCIALKKRLYDAILRHCYEGYRIFYTGMAEGVDLWAAEAIVRLNAYFPDLQLHAVIPYRDHRTSIGAAYRARYDTVLTYVTSFTVISETYTRDCFKARNYYIVEHSDALIAVYAAGQSRSGTGQTVRRAQTLGRRITVIDPNNTESAQGN